MASLVLLLHLLVLIAASQTGAQIHRHISGSLSFTPKGRDSSGSYEGEFRIRLTGYEAHVDWHGCTFGDCGVETSTNTIIDSDSFNLTWRQLDIVSRRKLRTNFPFEIRYPTRYNYFYRMGYWIENEVGTLVKWSMLTHVDLGTRSDTGSSNRPPITTILPIIRVTKQCPRTFSLTVFDPDGDRVTCRAPVHGYIAHEACGLCRLDRGFSLDMNSCSLTYEHSDYIGYHPIELIVEDFPKKHITVSYSDGSYTTKKPRKMTDRKRRSPTGDPTTTTINPISTTTTGAPTTTTINPISTTTTAAPTTTTINPISTTTTAAPTTTTINPISTTITAAPTTTTAPPTTTTINPISTTTTAAPITTTINPIRTTITAAPTTITAPPTTTAVPTTLLYTTTPLYRSSIPPLSRIPLDFTVYVDDYVIPSCDDGDYFPVFLEPTPPNGIYLHAFVNETFTIKVRSKAQYATIGNLIVTGPLRISKAKVSGDTYIIQWTPNDSELHDHFPICFVSEAIDGQQRVFHSELRCLTVFVEHHDTTVTCNETSIKIEVAKSPLIRHKENSLHLFDSSDTFCSLRRHSNVTHLVAVIPLNGCGTQIEEDENNIIFENVITSADTEALISREHDVEIAFSCSYPKQTNLTLGFRHKNPYAFREKGFGAFNFQFEFFYSQHFRRQVDSSSYPVEVYLKQKIYMQIEATTSIPNTELFVESCRATPYDNPNSRTGYTIIEHGCVKDETVEIYPASKSQFRFGMEAFEFIGAHEEVYITCSVLLCESGNPEARCSQGCVTSNSWDNRRKRDVPAQTSSHFISQGPLHLMKTSNTREPGWSLYLGLNLAFVVSCLLACGVVIYRFRRTRAKYQRLPSADSPVDSAQPMD